MKRLLKRAIVGILILAFLIPNTGCVLQPKYIEVLAEESVFEGKYYYQRYDESQQEVYREIYQGLMDQQEMFFVHGTDSDETNEILFTVLYDFPEICWTEGEVISTGYELFSCVTVRPTYICSKEEKEKREKEIREEAEEIIATIPEGYSDYQKVKYIYEYVINSVEYVDEAPDNQNIYSALINKKTVCAGYAKETQYLLELAGIPCIYVLGDATNDDGTDAHAWNIVYCEGAYYHVDTTWGDPLYDEDEESAGQFEIVYDYLCCSDAEIKDTHEPEAKYEYPECISETLNYYRVNNMYYENAERNALLNAMKQTINVKGERTTFKFANQEVYTQAKDLIINQLLDTALGYLGRKYYLRETQCFYTEYDEDNVFVIDWEYK